MLGASRPQQVTGNQSPVPGKLHGPRVDALGGVSCLLFAISGFPEWRFLLIVTLSSPSDRRQIARLASLIALDSVPPIYPVSPSTVPRIMYFVVISESLG